MGRGLAGELGCGERESVARVEDKVAKDRRSAVGGQIRRASGSQLDGRTDRPTDRPIARPENFIFPPPRRNRYRLREMDSDGGEGGETLSSRGTGDGGSLADVISNLLTGPGV